MYLCSSVSRTVPIIRGSKPLPGLLDMTETKFQRLGTISGSGFSTRPKPMYQVYVYNLSVMRLHDESLKGVVVVVVVYRQISLTGVLSCFNYDNYDSPF